MCYKWSELPIEKKLKPKDAKREYLKTIHNSMKRINKEVKMLRSFQTKNSFGKE